METVFDELKRYVRFGADEAGLLANFRYTAAPHFERISRGFYDRINEHEEARAVFTGDDQAHRLPRMLVTWMHGLFGGVYDETYFDRIVFIGRVHARVGLPQRFMFCAMALLRDALLEIAETEGGADGVPLRKAINRLLDIELAMMLEGYVDNLVVRPLGASDSSDANVTTP